MTELAQDLVAEAGKEKPKKSKLEITGEGLKNAAQNPVGVAPLIGEIAGKIVGKPGHNLEALFEQLLTVRAERGFSDDDELAESVRAMVALVQSVDPFADRFRYPTAKGGKPFEAVDADLERLFQAHWTIVVYCEGAALEVEESRSAQN